MEEVDERGGGGGSGPEECLLIKVHVPELNVQKCLQFPRDQLVWDVKQQCLAALPKELKESFNYGLFSPPENGRAGKFLDEERRLGDYSFSGPIGLLELKYKRRVYKMISLDEKQLKSLHTRANLRRFLEYVQNGQVEKVTKMCSKGLDPNYHCPETGETPLTIATAIKKPAKVLIALVNGGAILDYRTKDGSTALHRAVEKQNLEALQTLLELGASPNYKDNKGLTPLYLTITHAVDPKYTELLLHDHATTGAKDAQGWHEVHQACKLGLLQHLEHLLFYGADMNSQNATGNTPLHVCAVNGQESCARTLLFRGANREALNYSNQTPGQVAVIAGNMELSLIIQNYRQDEVVPYREPPRYNPKRRSAALGWLQRSPSASTLALPPSPCPSDRSSAPYSSASSSLSDASSGAPPGLETDTASIVTDKSLGDTSDIISDSSGVGTANSDTNCSITMPGATVVCIEAYTSKEEGSVCIRPGDFIEVTGATDDGYLEGIVKNGGNATGLFPAHCVQEVRLRNPNIQTPMMVARDSRQYSNNRVVGRRESTQSSSKHFATQPRTKKYTGLPGEPKTVVLHRGKKGFGFILRGAKATSPLMELTPSEKCPALQYLDDVDPGGVADMSGLKKGDFLIAINDEDVSSASHEHVVDLIRKSGGLVKMTVLSVGAPTTPSSSIPMSKSTILPCKADIPLSRHYATLPRKMNPGGTLTRNSQAPLPPRRDPKTTLSVGRARAKSMVAGLGGEKDETDDITKSSSAESIHQSTPGGTGNSTPVQPRTASIRQRPISSRVTSQELEELFEKQRDDGERGGGQHSSLMTSSRFQDGTQTLSHPGSPAKTRVYASVAEMKRSKNKKSKHHFLPFWGGRELRRDFHSTPDLAQEVAMLNTSASAYSKNHRSIEDISAQLASNRTLPPPNHPPPPPPQQIQLITLSRNSEYDNLTSCDVVNEESVVSSFRPTASAKLYASPEDMKSVGYRSKSLPSNSKAQVRKSQSMRTASSFKPTSTSTPPTKNTTYAQPFRPSRSHSSAGTRRHKKIPCSKSASNVVDLSKSNTPPIPEPDYSCSESEGETDEEKDCSNLATRLSSVQLHPVENSGNSNASGSSSGSSSVPHSFSVEEIQKGRSMLRSSKSYPDDFLKKQNDAGGGVALEDGDNSSSGVSSDQEITGSMNSEYTERLSASIQDNSQTIKNQRPQSGLLSRPAVSLVQLPPPIENETDEKEEFCLPPPPEFGGNASSVEHGPEAVLAPPPQFSDNRQVSRVRIVGAVPKNSTPKMKQGRLHSQ
ncbi:SH3 and multiple ankyrin repeat domains protein 2 isoform X3 [Aethina tumida]|uniref:SH3 and multiple ankyrin repeat domains protein 2 isoform X3 n=1 Tax=Aethina tumida TaxID=116153 RepID=UPI002147FA7F|nr:SH3 and multiple ankyrin repeat domains protein 2 isoform X3 [Aethina tumida]